MSVYNHRPWGNNPQVVMDRAKAHALSQLNSDHPKLTALERAYFIAFKRKSLQL